jgi:glutathione-regulated potassium-efflux system protein KefB
MAVEAHGTDLVRVVALLGAGVIAVPLFRRLRLGSVLGYLAAGLAIGPFGLRWFSDPQAMLHVAELGVVLFLFLIGLEMQPSRLWTLRREIFGLGAAQVTVCGLLLSAAAIAAGLPPVAAFIAAMGFVLSSTAIVMQILQERGEVSGACGQRVVSILLLEDLAIVPLLALVALLAPARAADSGGSGLALLLALGALVGLLVAGRWLLNPLFRLLAAARAREVMTAAALLVVLGAALLMQIGGLSMALGAFLAGVMLSESSFRHQLEADVEPFRGILLGLFFMGVGMSLDFSVFAAHWPRVLAGVVLFMLLKFSGVYAVARLARADHEEALERAALLAQGGEFAFVLYAAAAAAGLLARELHAILTAVVILSMAATPLVLALLRRRAQAPASMDGIDQADGLRGNVLLIGFGRFGQVASQAFLARGLEVSIIDTDTEMIRDAGDFGFKVYYGDGRRLDVLQASGAAEARVIAVCIDDREAARRIAELVRAEFPLAKLMMRSYDRAHALQLIAAGVDFQIRETFESAMAFGEAALRALGVPEAEAAVIASDLRRRDAERLELEMTGGVGAGLDLLHGNRPRSRPLIPPRVHEPAVASQRSR